MITKFTLFERKGDYPLFHITDNLQSILNDGFIKGSLEWDSVLRQNVLANWERGKYKTISATRNLNYMNGDTLELDVEKITDKYRIIPFSENPDFYNAFMDLKKKIKPNHSMGGDISGYGKMEPGKSPNVTDYQNFIRSKSRGAGKLYWRVKTNKQNNMDFGVAEELILTDKLDVGNYVKKIFLDSYNNKNLAERIKEKYPHIEIYNKENSYIKSLQNPILIEEPKPIKV